MLNPDILLPLFFAGAAAGFLAGLFGIGGGMIVVPIMLWLLDHQGIGGPYVQHMAIGTSFAVMVFTTFSGTLAHHRKKAVDWKVVKRMSPAMVAGGLIGSAVVKYIPTAALQLLFIVCVLGVAAQTLLCIAPKATRELPQRKTLAAVGSVFGLISSWVGIGGGTLAVPFLLFCNVPVHRATGTSAGLAWPMAAAGALGFLIAGWGVPGLPEGAFGFWFLPAVVILSACTAFFAPFGARTAHKLPPLLLKKGVGILMLLIAAKMIWQMLT